MIDLKAIKKKLRELLLEEIDEPIKELKNKIPDSNEKYDSIILWESQLKDLEKEEMRGTVSNEDAVLRRNRLRQLLIDFINDLEESDFEEQVAKTEKTGGKKSYRTYFLIGIPVLLIAVLLLIFLPKVNNTDPYPPVDPEPDPNNPTVVDTCDQDLSQIDFIDLDTSLVYIIINADSSKALRSRDEKIEFSNIEELNTQSFDFYWRVKKGSEQNYAIAGYNSTFSLSADKNGIGLTKAVVIPNYSWKLIADSKNKALVYAFSVNTEQCITIDKDSSYLIDQTCCTTVLGENSNAIQFIGFPDPTLKYSINSKKDADLALRNRNNKHIRLTRLKGNEIPADQQWKIALISWQDLQPIWKVISLKDSNRLMRVAITNDNDLRRMNVLPKFRNENINQLERQDWYFIPDPADPTFYTLQSRYKWNNSTFYLEILNWRTGKREMKVQMIDNYINGDLYKLWSLRPIKK